jgi:hypothetical protein
MSPAHSCPTRPQPRAVARYRPRTRQRPRGLPARGHPQHTRDRRRPRSARASQPCSQTRLRIPPRRSQPRRLGQKRPRGSPSPTLCATSYAPFGRASVATDGEPRPGSYGDPQVPREPGAPQSLHRTRCASCRITRSQSSGPGGSIASSIAAYSALASPTSSPGSSAGSPRISCPMTSTVPQRRHQLLAFRTTRLSGLLGRSPGLAGLSVTTLPNVDVDQAPMRGSGPILGRSTCTSTTHRSRRRPHGADRTCGN